ncbi:MAG: aldo/keto reductase [Rhodospirillaceae bacterium]|nr:aldo/keto reductase [Rhodospirillaceae bacterium]
MLTRFVPSTKEPLPVIGLGTFRAFDTKLGPGNRDALTEVLRLFFEAGGSLIDTSPMYGRAEAVIGELLDGASFQDQAFLATKVWTSGRRRGIRQMQDSLAKLRRPSVRLMQVHNLVDCETQLETLRAWKQDGRIDYIGITHYTSSAFAELADLLKSHPDIDFCQFPYSIAARRAEDYFLDLCADTGTATLINRPFEQDGLFGRVHGAPLPSWAGELGITGWGPFFLKYLLSFDAVTCLIPATSNPDHMRANLAAGTGSMPDAAMRRRMSQLFDSL